VLKSVNSNIYGQLYSHFHIHRESKSMKYLATKMQIWI